MKNKLISTRSEVVREIEEETTAGKEVLHDHIRALDIGVGIINDALLEQKEG